MTFKTIITNINNLKVNKMNNCKCGSSKIKEAMTRGAMTDVFNVVYCEECLTRTNGCWDFERAVIEWNKGVFSEYKLKKSLVIKRG